LLAGIRPGTGVPWATSQSHSLREPSSSVASGANSGESGVEQAAIFAADTFGTAVMSACNALPRRSAAMVLTQGMPSVSLTAVRISATFRALPMRSQVSITRWLARLASLTAKAVVVLQVTLD
jgi:hypothetical protein